MLAEVVDTHGCNFANGAFSEEKGMRLVASIDHSLYGTRRSQTVAILDQAIAGPIVLDCPSDPTVSIEASSRSIAG